MTTMVKNTFKEIIVFILTLEAKLVLWRFKPKIVAVTGSVGKTSTKDAIYTALQGEFRIRKNKKSLNSEIGTPLTVLGLDNAWSDPVLWLKNICLGFLQFFKTSYPAWLVIEVGADHPGDVRRIAKWLKPDVVVVTTMPEIPVHVEFFESPEALIEEDLSIIEYMKPGGTLVMNADEPKSAAIIERSKMKTITYGTAENADIRFTNKAVMYDTIDGISMPTGISCKIEHDGNTVPVALSGVLGIQHLYPLTAAVAVGLSQSISIIHMTSALAQHTAPPGRMNLIEGMNDSLIIDDSYNASPIAVERALESLAALEVPGKKIVVIGDMLEIGRFTAAEHKKVGEHVAKIGVAHLVAVGLRAEYVAEEACKHGMKESQVSYVRTADEAIKIVQPLLKKGDVMLVKGSQGIRAEKVVAACMADPSQKEALLVRQEAAWKNR